MKRLFSPPRPSADDRLDMELRDHVERQVADYVAAGMSEADARRRARLELGGLQQAREACRDVRRFQYLDAFARDVRVGFRGLARDRFFAASVIVILALGIGISVTMFSVLASVVLQPLPYARPGELASLSTHLMRQNQFDGTSMANYTDWRQQSQTFAAMTFYRRTSVSVVTFSGVDAPQRAREGLVGPEFFELLGTPPLIGRTMSASEFSDRERVVVLSEGLWIEQFGGARDAVGKSLTIDGERHVVIGVMPRTFRLPTSDTRFWRPLSLLPLWAKAQFIRDSDQFEVLGRLKPGVRLEDAQREMGLIAARLRETYDENRDRDIRVISILDHVVDRQTRRGVWIAAAAVLSLSIVACANVAGLLSTRAARRRRELAVRSVLGARRGTLVRQLMTESVSVWAVAGTFGILLAYQLIALLLAYGPQTIPRMEDLRLDMASVATALVAALAVVAACGTIPAFVATKAITAATFATRDTSSMPRQRLVDLLVTAQVACALMLSIVASLLVHSFIRADREDPGYPAEHLVIARIELPRQRYPDRTALAAFFREVQARVGRLPGVVAVGGITDFLIRRNADQRVTVEGRGADPDGYRLAIEGVTPGYFRATGIEVLEGRDFDERDYESGAAGVVIVSSSLARKFWPGESAVGKRMVAGSTPPKDGVWNTVVGVIEDLRREGLDVAPIPLAFTPSFLRNMDLTIHTATPAETVIPSVREQIRSLDGSLPVPTIVTAGARLSERLAARRFEAQVIGAFAFVALMLSAAGLYASLAYQVTVRTREIGIRCALGARRRSIVSMIVANGLRLTVPGAILGLAAAAGAAKTVRSLLYETAATDVPSYAVSTVLVLLVAVAAAGVPARRAAGVSPMTALRHD